ncbi:MAG TPA: DinB family protein [Bacteroidetes bacterium]|nr:DinB family protein [Bacteroidota bacterium]
MTADDLRRMFRFNLLTLRRNLSKLTHEQSLFLPPEGGNRINWILGHLLATRADLLALLGAEPFWSEEQRGLYSAQNARADGESLLELGVLARTLVDSQRPLEAVIENADESLAEVSSILSSFDSEATLGQRLSYFALHEVYHAGQIGSLRRRVGLPGAIG